MKQVKAQLRTRSVSKEDVIETLNREALPVLSGVRELVNRLAAGTEVSSSSGSALTLDWSRAHYQSVTLTANCAFTFLPTADTVAAALLVLRVIQDGTGGWAPTWPTSVLWPAGSAPTITVGAGAIDLIVFYTDGTYFYGVPVQNFS